MNDVQNQTAPTEEEIHAEQEALKETPEAELKAKVVKEFELEEGIDDELIDKLVKREAESKKALSKAIRQKINLREAAANAVKKEVKTETKTEAPDIDKLVDAKLAKHETERTINSLEYSDDVKNSVRSLVNMGKSVSEALKDSYIIFKMEAEERAEQNEGAGVRRTPRAFSRDGGNPGRRGEDPLAKVAQTHYKQVARGESIHLGEDHFKELEENLKEAGADVSKHLKIGKKVAE